MLPTLPSNAADRLRLLRLTRRALVPRLDARGRRSLRLLAGESGWQPVPLPPGMGAIEALLWTHCQAAGLDPRDVYTRHPSWGRHRPPERRRRLAAWVLRRRALEALLRLAHGASVGRLLLFKGEALAPFLDDPTLRYMGDTDIVTGVDDAARLIQGLARSRDFQPGPAEAAGCWIHRPTNAVFDLHVPATAMGRELLDRAVPHPRLDDLGVLWPRPADHLLLLAEHAITHTGMRIWRDVLDVRALLVEEDGRAVVTEAREVARAHDLIDPLVALLRFVDLGGAAKLLPEDSPEEADPVIVGRLFRLYRSGAFLAVPPSTVKNVRHLALTTARSPWSLVGMVAGAIRRDRGHRDRRGKGLVWVSREQRREEGKGFLRSAVGKGAAATSLLFRSDGRALWDLLKEQDALRQRYPRIFQPVGKA